MTAVQEQQSEDFLADPTRARPVTVRLAPRREPPFDDEREQPTFGPLRVVGRSQPPLPFDPSPARLTAAQAWAAPRPTSRGELPDPASWSRRLLVAVLEARAGQRSLRQLATYFSPAVHAGLIAEFHRTPAAHLQAGQPQPQARRAAAVKSVHVCEPADGVAEISAVIATGSRYHAVAARLEGLDGRWRCVRLQLG
jgi:hypothetical protein